MHRISLWNRISPIRTRFILRFKECTDGLAFLFAFESGDFIVVSTTVVSWACSSSSPSDGFRVTATELAAVSNLTRTLSKCEMQRLSFPSSGTCRRCCTLSETVRQQWRRSISTACWQRRSVDSLRQHQMRDDQTRLTILCLFRCALWVL